MGKKIPKSKKHRKLKFVDPSYRGPVRHKNNLLYNEPPTAEDDQEGSRQLAEFTELRNKAKSKLKRKKKKKALKDDFIIVKNKIIDNIEPGMKKVKNIPAVVKQKRFENENQFFNRLQKMADVAIAEAKVEEKYNIELVNVDKKGNAEYVEAPKEATENQKEKRKKYKEKIEEKKRLKTEDKDFDLKKEHIQFGEVVSAPPVFKSKPRKAPELNTAGSRQLALKKFLPSTSQETEKKVKSTKWRTLPPARRKVMESEQLRAVQMYRMLKNKKAS